MLLKNQKIVGVLGGMGPFAALLFFKRLLELTPAKKDWEHMRIVIDNNTKIPSRSRHYLYNEESPVPEMIRSCLCLQDYPVDFIVIPCNSASYFLSDVQRSVKIPILNIFEITVKALKNKFPYAHSIAVLGGVITYKKETYKFYIEKEGLKYLDIAEKYQCQVERLIEQIKLNNISKEVIRSFKNIVNYLKQRCDADAVILGCTEFGYLADIDVGIPVVDSTDELARYTVFLANSEDT